MNNYDDYDYSELCSDCRHGLDHCQATHQRLIAEYHKREGQRADRLWRQATRQYERP